MALNLSPASSPTCYALEPTNSELLDALLTRYLRLLDQYEKLRIETSTQFSNGFLSLAQANFQAPNRSTRYGQDLYDERMQASLGINITVSPSGATKFNLSDLLEVQPPVKSISSDPEPETEPENEVEDAQAPTPPLSPNPEQTQALICQDPIRQFGILVPQSLRNAQASFVTAIRDHVMRLAGLEREMWVVEEEVKALRNASSAKVEYLRKGAEEHIKGY